MLSSVEHEFFFITSGSGFNLLKVVALGAKQYILKDGNVRWKSAKEWG